MKLYSSWTSSVVNRHTSTAFFLTAAWDELHRSIFLSLFIFLSLSFFPACTRVSYHWHQIINVASKTSFLLLLRSCILARFAKPHYNSLSDSSKIKRSYPRISLKINYWGFWERKKERKSVY